MHRLPQYHRGNPGVECHNICQVNQYDTSIVTSRIHTARYISCVLISEYSIRQDKTLKGKDSIHHNKSIDGRNIIWSDYINKAHDIDHERERDQAHSDWYKPSAPRVDYSFLVVVAAGMMKMATRDDSLLRQGDEIGLDWFSVATEPCGGGTSDLG